MKKSVITVHAVSMIQFPVGATMERLIAPNGDVFIKTHNDPALAFEGSKEETAAPETAPAPAKASTKKAAPTSAKPVEKFEVPTHLKALYESSEEDLVTQLPNHFKVRSYVHEFDAMTEGRMTKDEFFAHLSTLEYKEAPVIPAAPAAPKTKKTKEAPAPVVEEQEEEESDDEDLSFEPFEDFQLEVGDIVYLSEVENPENEEDVTLVKVKSVAPDHFTAVLLDAEGNEDATSEPTAIALSSDSEEYYYYPFIASAQ